MCKVRSFRKGKVRECIVVAANISKKTKTHKNVHIDPANKPDIGLTWCWAMKSMISSISWITPNAS